MPGLTDVKINKVSGGLGFRGQNADAVAGLIVEMPAAGGLSLGEVLKCESASDAKGAGIDAEFDATNRVLVYEHIKEFFEYAPDGLLYVMGVAQDTGFDAMCDSSVSVSALQGLLEAQPDIRFVGLAKNPTDSYEFTSAGGVDDDVLSAIPKAQSVVDTFGASNRFVDAVILEGRELSGTMTSLPDLRLLGSENISVVCGQSGEVAGRDTLYGNYGAVGSLLGMIAVRKVSESCGSVDIEQKPDDRRGTENYPLSWSSARLSSGLSSNQISAEYHERLRERGIIYAANHEGYPGIYFAGQGTCTASESDFRYISHNRVWNKAARLVLRALIPMVQSGVDLEDGAISSEAIKTIEGKGSEAISAMVVSDEINNFSVAVQSAGDLESALQVRIGVTPKKVLYKIEADLMFEL